MSDQFVKKDLPWTTVSPDTLSATDIGTIGVQAFRTPKWWDREGAIFEQAVENDTAFLAFLESGAVDTNIAMTQPIIQWRVGRPADLWTTNDVAIASSTLTTTTARAG